MTKDQLTQSVYLRLGGKYDFAPEPFILAKADEAIKRVVKQMVYGNNPMSSLFIDSATPTIVSSPSTKMGFKYAELSDSIIRTSPKLHLATYVSSSTKYIMEPVNSWKALDTLPAQHDKAYYKIHENTLYFKLPSGTADSLYIEHYQYPSLTNYPFELVDVLLDVLVPMLGPAPTEQAMAQKEMNEQNAQ